MNSAHFTFLLLLLANALPAANPTKPLLYVTQIPRPEEVNNRDFKLVHMSCASPIQNPLGDTSSAGRGGSLMLRLANGTLRNLTKEAGFGSGNSSGGNVTGAQGANSIAVQRPQVNWTATRAVFSMVVGAPTSAADSSAFFWQLYEVTNLDLVLTGTPAVIAKVPNQPINYDNLHASYATDGRIIFTSDRPRNGQAQLWPQREEYLLQPINSGIWSIDPTVSGGDLKMLVHCPSGAYTPFVDSFGRLLFVQWDHLIRDVMALTDKPPIVANGDAWTQTTNGCGNYANESAAAAFTTGTNDVYPEPRNADKTSLLAAGNLNGNALNIFTLWSTNEDGSEHEMLNHVGRHELFTSFLPSFTDDPNLVSLSLGSPARTTVNNMYQVIESPTQPGLYFGIDAPDIGTHGGGQIVSTLGGPSVNPGAMAITYVSAKITANLAIPPAQNAASTDLYRNVLPLSDGNLAVIRASVKSFDANKGTAAAPLSYFDFRLMSMKLVSGFMVPDLNLTAGSTATSATWFENGNAITYTGPLWELDPVEVTSRTKPATTAGTISGIENQVFTEEGVDVPTFQKYLRTQNAALIVSRNVTRRDKADKQQPFNLKVAWPTSTTQTVGATGKIYDIGYLQIMQADALRGLTTDTLTPLPGRRVVPTPLHDTAAEMPVAAGAPAGAVKIADDGSTAAIVPANRAVSWHLMDGTGTKSVVKERFWVNFKPGEIRTCAVCHGLNTTDQAGNAVPTNKPLALRDLLQFWKGIHPPGTMQHTNASNTVPKANLSITIPVARTGGSTGPVSVNYTTVNGSALAGVDYTFASGSLTWLDGDTTSKNITISLGQNPVVAANKSFTITLSNPVNGALGILSSSSVSLAEKPFDAWRLSQFPLTVNSLGIGTALDDPDLDGLNNVIEYAFALDPKKADSAALPQPFTAGNTVGYSFTEPAGVSGVTYTAESSPDLMHWTSVPDTGSGTTHIFTRTNQTRVFLRLGLSIN